MRVWRVRIVVVLASFGLAGLILSACSTVQRTVVVPPEIEGATFVGNAACVDCHTNISRTFASSPHGRFHKDDLKWAGHTGCESCHGPGSKHVAVGGGRGRFIVNPSKSPDTCFQCHVDIHADFNLPQHHPVVEGRMNCSQCHDPHGMDILKPAGGLAMARENQTCAQCHREQARPFIYEHEAMREGCTVCHQPHGSINPKMLVENDANLCLKCHAQIQGPSVPEGEIFIGKVSHASFLRMGTCWSAGCHTAVHGSNINPKLRH